MKDLPLFHLFKEKLATVDLQGKNHQQIADDQKKFLGDNSVHHYTFVYMMIYGSYPYSVPDTIDEQSIVSLVKGAAGDEKLHEAIYMLDQLEFKFKKEYYKITTTKLPSIYPMLISTQAILCSALQRDCSFNTVRFKPAHVSKNVHVITFGLDVTYTHKIMPGTMESYYVNLTNSKEYNIHIVIKCIGHHVFPPLSVRWTEYLDFILKEQIENIYINVNIRLAEVLGYSIPTGSIVKLETNIDEDKFISIGDIQTKDGKLTLNGTDPQKWILLTNLSQKKEDQSQEFYNPQVNKKTNWIKDNEPYNPYGIHSKTPQQTTAQPQTTANPQTTAQPPDDRQPQTTVRPTPQATAQPQTTVRPTPPIRSSASLSRLVPDPSAVPTQTTAQPTPPIRSSATPEQRKIWKKSALIAMASRDSRTESETDQPQPQATDPSSATPPRPASDPTLDKSDASFNPTYTSTPTQSAGGDQRVALSSHLTPLKNQNDSITSSFLTPDTIPGGQTSTSPPPIDASTFGVFKDALASSNLSTLSSAPELASIKSPEEIKSLFTVMSLENEENSTGSPEVVLPEDNDLSRIEDDPFSMEPQVRIEKGRSDMDILNNPEQYIAFDKDEVSDFYPVIQEKLNDGYKLPVSAKIAGTIRLPIILNKDGQNIIISEESPRGEFTDISDFFPLAQSMIHKNDNTRILYCTQFPIQ